MSPVEVAALVISGALFTYLLFSLLRGERL